MSGTRGIVRHGAAFSKHFAACTLDAAKAELVVSGVSGRSKPYVLRGETGPAGAKKMKEWHTKIRNAALDDGLDPS